jgi:hypothetical protein
MLWVDIQKTFHKSFILVGVNYHEVIVTFKGTLLQ